MKFFRPKSSDANCAFYRRIINGEYGNYIWGGRKRFDPERVLKSPSIRKYFLDRIRPYINQQDKVLDVGSGSGVFLPFISTLCSELVALEISLDMIGQCSNTARRYNLDNVSVLNGNSLALPFKDETFDVVTAIDVLHHISGVEEAIRGLVRVLRPGGFLLMFEPNKYNILLALLCMLDRNEWGAIRLGSKRAYRRLFKKKLELEYAEYNGLLIGPDSNLNRWLADMICESGLRKVFLFQAPKIFMVFSKPR